MNTLRRKTIFSFIDTPSTQSTKRNATSNYYSRTKRAQTEHNAPEVSSFEPKKKRNREFLLPQSHQEYLKAKREIEKTYQQQQRRKRVTQSDIPIDLKMAFIIKRQTVTGRKILHKSSFEESITSPTNKQRLEQINEELLQIQPIQKEPELEQEDLGQFSLHPEWEKRWEQLFETFFEMQSVKQKNISQVDQQRKDSRVKYNRAFQNSDTQNNNKLNYIELITLRREFLKPPSLRDTQKLEPIFMKNRIFTKLNDITRKLIIQSSKLKECQPDELLLSNEVNQDKVYVIFQGSCKVVMTKFNKDDEILGSMVIRSIYDGYHISIDNLLIEKKIDEIKKMSNIYESNLQQYIKSEIYAQEKSILIEISLDIYNQVLTYAIDEEMQEKINLLKNIRIINCNRDLRPLAAILQCKKFKFGDIIISAGQEINNFYIIKTGRIRVAICTRQQNELINDFYDLKPNELLNSTKNIDHCGKIIKCVNNKKILEMNVHIQLKNLEVGEIFGSSSLISIQEIKKINKYKNDNIAKVSLIALTPIVELYIIDSMEFETLPDGFQHQLKELCLTQNEFDDYNVEQIIEDHDKWQKIKKDYYTNSVKQKQ